MRKLFSRLGFQIGFGVSVMLCLLTAALFVPLFNQSKSALLEAAANKQNMSINILANEMATKQEIVVKKAPDGQILGATAPAIAAFDDHSLIDTVGEISGETATVFVWDETQKDYVRRSTNIIKPDGARAVGTVLGRENPVYQYMMRAEVYRGKATILGKDYLTIYVPVQNTSGAPLGILYVGVSEAALSASISGMLWSGLSIAALSLAGFLAMTIFALRFMLAPIGGLSGAVRSIREGEYNTLVPHTDRPDGIGAVARSVDAFRTQLIENKAEQEAAERLDRERQSLFEAMRKSMDALKQGNVQTRMETNAWSELGDGATNLCENFNELAHAFDELTGQVKASVAAVREGAMDLQAMSGDMSRRAENQAATLEESAAALEEISNSVKMAAERAKTASEMAIDGRHRAETGSGVMQRAMEAMSSITSSSDEISSIISVIDDIAFQTNLLALNAGVEAARAGEAGKGFAVVASEVRTLAQRASESAREIKELVTRSAEQVEQGSRLMEETNGTFNSIVESSGKTADLVSEIATAAQEQATGVQEINTGVSELDTVTQQNAAMVVEINATCEKLTIQTDRASDLISAFLGGPRPANDKSTPGTHAQRATAHSGKAEDHEPAGSWASLPAEHDNTDWTAPAEGRLAANDTAWSNF
ncbi:methyl-accepting chemotaxis protein [Mameliella sediminis]|uniref:methyl-accepting chemotaxis protein n=1 Tax=Mameliella sediminis TaxID=2836866 RepID=UPI001C448B1E|nr:methyl-accepting chemotaxis protein [Mameliella sediminis]